MKRSPKQTGRERVVVGVLAAEAVEAEAGTIIAATLVNRANRAGKIVFLTGVRRRAPPQRSDGTNQLGEKICHEADQPGQSAKRNKHVNRVNVTKRNVASSENRKRRLRATPTIWLSCTSTRLLKRRCSKWVPIRRTRPNPVRLAKSPATDSKMLLTVTDLHGYGCRTSISRCERSLLLSRIQLRRSLPSIEDFLLALFGNQGLECGHDFVASCHKRADFRLVQIVLGYLRYCFGRKAL